MAFQCFRMFSLIYLFHCLLSWNSYPTIEAKAVGMRLLIRIKATVAPFVCILISFEKKTQSDTSSSWWDTIMLQQGSSWNSIFLVLLKICLLATECTIQGSPFCCIVFNTIERFTSTYMHCIRTYMLVLLFQVFWILYWRHHELTSA